MNAEIICVGTELLLGDILNTNARFLARELASEGVNVLHQQVVGDNAQRLEEAVYMAKDRAELVVLCGGLGPTDDDLTKQTVAGCFGDELVFEPKVMEAITEYFASTGRSTPENNRRQAYVPKNGGWIHNENGTAPAVWFRDGNNYALLLPGPPRELEPMWRDAIHPTFHRNQSRAINSLVLRVTGLGESHIEEKVSHLLQGENPSAALYAKPGDVRIRITASADTNMEARALCRNLAKHFYAILGDWIYGEGEEELENRVVELYTKKQMTLATAESCTGGMVAQRITSVPGSSQMFGYGFVTYANAAKRNLLGVDPYTLADFGAVSPQTAAAMAAGARKMSNADVAVSLTGIAGPDGGTEEKPVGLVYLGVATKEKTLVKKLLLGSHGRDTVRQMAANYALDAARRLAQGLEIPGAYSLEK